MDAEQLFREHHEAIFRYLVRFTGDRDSAADAAQEAFTRLLERPPPGKVERAWLFKVATNAALETARTHGRRLRLLQESPDRIPVGDRPAAADTQVEANQRRRVVQQALADLSPKERTVLLMREEGFSHREIAEAAGTMTGSVGTLIARALEKLAARLPLDRESL